MVTVDVKVLVWVNEFLIVDLILKVQVVTADVSSTAQVELGVPVPVSPVKGLPDVSTRALLTSVQ